MSADDQMAAQEMDAGDLYLEETFTDRKMGSIRRLSPVKADGSPDGGRQVVYVGQAQLYTGMGSIPLAFEIDAGSLEEAARKFAAGAEEAVERTMKELNELRREAASSIVLPGAGMGGALGGPGGMPGGGKIQMP